LIAAAGASGLAGGGTAREPPGPWRTGHRDIFGWWPACSGQCQLHPQAADRGVQHSRTAGLGW